MQLQNLILEDGIQSFNLNYNDYLKYSLLKTRKDTINLQGINLNSKINNLKKSSSDSSENLSLNDSNKNEKMNYFHLSFLYTYPEIFRCLFRKKYNLSHKSIQKFIYDKIQLNKNELEIKIDGNLKIIEGNEWKAYLKEIYSGNLNINNIEKNLNEIDFNLIKKEELNNFRNFSLAHITCCLYEKIIRQNFKDYKSCNNIIFSGGVLNIPGLKEQIIKDFDSLLLDKKRFNLHFPDIDNCAYSINKGANYMAKLDELKNIAVSKKSYLELGAEKLSFTYI